jgi:hypothetical protein
VVKDECIGQGRYARIVAVRIGHGGRDFAVKVDKLAKEVG